MRSWIRSGVERDQNDHDSESCETQGMLMEETLLPGFSLHSSNLREGLNARAQYYCWAGGLGFGSLMAATTFFIF